MKRAPRPLEPQEKHAKYEGKDKAKSIMRFLLTSAARLYYRAEKEPSLHLDWCLSTAPQGALEDAKSAMRSPPESTSEGKERSGVHRFGFRLQCCPGNAGSCRSKAQIWIFQYTQDLQILQSSRALPSTSQKATGDLLHEKCRGINCLISENLLNLERQQRRAKEPG